MLPTLASIFLDYKCNFACAHCSVGSSPKTKMKMSEEVFDRIFSELPKVPSIKVLVFTGGEATLHPDLLKKGLRQAKKIGIKTRLVTNAWWAKNPEKSDSYLKSLIEEGLDEINTSYDDFHQPFMGLTPVGNLIQSALKYKVPVGLGVINDKNARYDTSYIKEKIAEQLGQTQDEIFRWVSVVDDFATPSGTGEDLDIQGLDAGSKLDVGCPEIMKTISFHPNGSVKACCGHAQLYAKDLAAGNILTTPLEKIIETGTQNILYWWIHYVGPKKILRKLGVDKQYASICHACSDLLGPHRELLKSYLLNNKNAILMDDIVLGNNIANMADWIISQEHIIVSNLEINN